MDKKQERKLMPRKINPMRKILELYRDLKSPEERRACMDAMAVFSGEPPKEKKERKPKTNSATTILHEQSARD